MDRQVPLNVILGTTPEVLFYRHPRYSSKDVPPLFALRDGKRLSTLDGKFTSGELNWIQEKDREQLTISGSFESALNFQFILRSGRLLSPSEEAAEALCCGEFYLNGALKYDVAVYRTTAPPPARISVHVFVFGMNPSSVRWTANNTSYEPTQSLWAFTWDTDTDFVITRHKDTVIVPKPTAPGKDLWIMVSTLIVTSLCGTQTPIASYGSHPIDPPIAAQPAATLPEQQHSLRHRHTAAPKDTKTP